MASYLSLLSCRGRSASREVAPRQPSPARRAFGSLCGGRHLPALSPRSPRGRRAAEPGLPEQAEPLAPGDSEPETQAPPALTPRSPRGLDEGAGAVFAVCSTPLAGAQPGSLRRRAAVLAVSSGLLVATVWFVASRGPFHGHGEPEGGRSTARSRILESPPAGAAAGNTFGDTSREIAAEAGSGREGGARAAPGSLPAAAAGHGAIPPSHDPRRRHGPPYAVENRSGPLHDRSRLNRSENHPPRQNLSRSHSSEHQNLSHNRSGQHHNLSRNHSSEHQNLSHNHQVKPKPKPKPKNITEKVEEITKRDGWTLHPGKNCYVGHGSQRFPDGNAGDTDTNGTKIDLDDCMLACAADKWCDGIVVDAGKTKGSCSLRSGVVISSCLKDEVFNTWQRGSIGGRVKRMADAYGWTRYERKNCYVGHGSKKYPMSMTPYSSKSKDISLSECMQRCQEDPICEAIVTSHDKNMSHCHLRAWVEPDDCVHSKELDLWRMDEGRKVPGGIELPSGNSGLERLVGVADMITQRSFGRLDFTRCALVGASGVMEGSNAGEDIDDHTAVIRLNRMPTPEFHSDFGKRTDVLYVSKEWGGAVALMGGENPRTSMCEDVPGCPEAAVLTRGDLDRCDPTNMADTWGPTHPLVGCTHTNVSRMVATGFRTLKGKLATAGLQAFFTFLPVCDELDLYGFGGTSTADGHNEWSNGHNLAAEHHIQHKVINGELGDLPWRNMFKEFDWIKEHAAKVRLVVGSTS